MKAKHVLAVLTLCLLIFGCIPSLHPLYTEKDIVFEPALIGVWASKDSSDTFDWRTTCEFITGDSQSYKMIFSTDSTSANFTAHLAKLGNHLFLDLLPDKSEIKNGCYPLMMIPAHSFYKVTLRNNFLRLDWIDERWVEEALKLKEITLSYANIDIGLNGILLTGSTEELQSLALTYFDEERAFPTGWDYFRQ